MSSMRGRLYALTLAMLESGHGFLLTLLPFFFFTPGLLYLKPQMSQAAFVLGLSFFALKIGQFFALLYLPYLIERKGLTGAFLFFCLGYLLLALLGLFACLWHLPFLLALGLLLHGLTNVNLISGFVNALPGDPERLLKRMAAFQGFWLLGAMLGPMYATLLGDHLVLSWMPWVGLFCMTVGAMLLLRAYPSTQALPQVIWRKERVWATLKPVLAPFVMVVMLEAAWGMMVQMFSGMSHLIFGASPGMASRTTTLAILSLALTAFLIRFSSEKKVLLWQRMAPFAFVIGALGLYYAPSLFWFDGFAMLMAFGSGTQFLILVTEMMSQSQQPIGLLSLILAISALTWALSDVLGGCLLAHDPHDPILWSLGWSILVCYGFTRRMIMQ